MDFGQRLTIARKGKGISQEALADSLGISRQAVSKWETGESKPDVSNLIALCEKLDLNIEYLCFGTVTPPVQMQEKRSPSRKFKTFLSVLIVVTCLLVGGLVGGLVGFSFNNENSPVRSHMPDMESVSVENVTVEHDINNIGYNIVVTPGYIHEEIQVLLLVETEIGLPFTLSCEFDGFSYSGHLYPEENVEYRITVVFCHEGTQKQIPILDFIARESICEYVHLWEKQN